MTEHTRYRDCPAFETKDGSEIRELMHPDRHGNDHQSLAEARVAPGQSTILHRHRTSEELYHVTAGRGEMTLDGERFEIGPGDIAGVHPGGSHGLKNTGTEDIHFIVVSVKPA